MRRIPIVFLIAALLLLPAAAPAAPDFRAMARR
jgi:hypothetical protein